MGPFYLLRPKVHSCNFLNMTEQVTPMRVMLLKSGQSAALSYKRNHCPPRLYFAEPRCSIAPRWMATTSARFFAPSSPLPKSTSRSLSPLPPPTMAASKGTFRHTGVSSRQGTERIQLEIAFRKTFTIQFTIQVLASYLHNASRGGRGQPV